MLWKEFYLLHVKKEKNPYNHFNISCQNKLLLKKIICSRVVTFSLMSCSPAPNRPVCSSHCDFPHLSPCPLCPAWGTGASSNQDRQTPHTNLLQWGQVYKWSLSKTEQSFSGLKRCRPVFPDPCSSFPYSSGSQEPTCWSQQIYLSGDRFTCRFTCRSDMGTAPAILHRTPGAFEPWAKDVLRDAPVPSAGLLTRPLYICAAGPSSENSCKNAVYSLLKCCFINFPFFI